MISRYVKIILILLLFQSKGIANEKYLITFQDICTNLRIDTNKIKILNSSTGIAYCKNLDNEKAEIYYNPDIFDKYPIDFFVGVICHELGHYINKDKDGCDVHAEGKADLAAGYSMRKLGFDINSAQLFLKVYKDAAKVCYPSQDERESLVRQGWDALNKEIIKKNGYNRLVPRITWSITSDYCLKVKIDERILEYKNWMKTDDVVIIYDSITTSTIQLLEYKRAKLQKGLGRLVTSQTLYTYFLFPKKIKKGYNFQVYYKGELIPTEDCDREEIKQERSDLIIHCRNYNNGNAEMGFRLIDYDIAPDYYVLPAIYQ